MSVPGPLVLVVDDDANLSELVRGALENRGYATAAAHDGLEGVRLAKEKKPHLVILDVNMPRLNGWEALRYLKENPATKDIPVLMLTTEGMIKDVEKALGIGAKSFLVKPFDSQRLLKKVAEILG